MKREAVEKKIPNTYTCFANLVNQVAEKLKNGSFVNFTKQIAKKITSICFVNLII